MGINLNLPADEISFASLRGEPFNWQFRRCLGGGRILTHAP